MPNTNISVCLLALNEAKHLAQALHCARSFATEIIVVIDSLTSDDSPEIAKQYADKVVVKQHQENFHINKQAAIDMATCEWIFWLDADEYLEKELIEEIKTELQAPKADGYLIPRKNLVFGKWLEHGGWYPDLQLRLFKKGKGKYPCEKIHENPVVEGDVNTFTHALIHTNYESISQYLEKINRYTNLDAKHLIDELKPTTADFIKRPVDDFTKRLLAWEGYKDGIHGLTVALLQAIYEFVVVAKIWEMKEFRVNSKNQLLPQVEKQLEQSQKDWKWWKRELSIRHTKSSGEKILLKLVRKIGL